MSRIKLSQKLAGALLPATLLLSVATLTNAATITGGTTSVTLDTATVEALTSLGFSVAPVSPSTLGGTPLMATFPITGGDTTSVINHSGGLAFTKSSTTASIENFTINLSGPKMDTITGQLSAGSTTVTGVTLFDIGSGLSLTLDTQLAGDLSSAFGIPNLAGTPIGTASVNPTTAVTPEPASIGLVSVGILAAAYLSRRRSPRLAISRR